MEIKQKLKTWGITLSRMALDLQISRPTLDVYISCYEKGDPIPNTRCQEVFGELFSEKITSAAEFHQVYELIVQSRGPVQTKDEQEKSSPPRDGILSDTMDELLNMVGTDAERKKFVLFMTKEYSDPCIQSIYRFLQYKNGELSIQDDELSDLDQALYSQLFTLFERYESGTVGIDVNGFRKFIIQNQNERLNKEDIGEMVVSILKTNRYKLNEQDIMALKQEIERM